MTPPIRWFLLPVLFICFSACAKPGAYFVELKYLGDPSPRSAGRVRVGLQGIEDRRGVEVKDFLGSRAVGSGREELFLTRSTTVADAVTAAYRSFLEKKGFQVESVSGWDLTPEGMGKVKEGQTYLVGGSVEFLRCDAVKRLGRTDLTLEVRLSTAIGNPAEGRVKTVPIAVKLERTELTFDPEKLEGFINETLTDAITTSLADLNG